MKALAVRVALIFATVAVAALLWQFREAIVLFALALAAAAVLRPLIDLLVARGVRRSLALALTCAGVFAVSSLVVLVAGARLLVEAQRGAGDLLRAYDSASGSQASLLNRMLIERLPAFAALYRELGSSGPGAQAVLGLTTSALSIAARAVIVLAMSVYWLANRDAFEHWGLSLLSPDWRVRTRETWRAAKAAVGAHLRSQLAQSAFAMIVLELGFQAIGLRYATLPAVAGGLARLVPVVGVPVAVLIAAAAGLASGSVQAVCAGLLAAGTFILIAALGARAFPLRRHNALLEIVILIALADAYGLPGVFVAAPISAALQVVGERLLFRSRPRAATDLHGVALRLAALRQRIAQSNKPVRPELAGVVDRLDGLVGAAQRLESRPWAPR